jgi:ADP-ribose pyrophosphatase YjhB (NUDIX family)
MPHIHEKIDWTVEVFLVNGDQVLLRKHDKYKMWLSIGGHVELDEVPTEAAIREVKEEVGLDATFIGEAPDIAEGDGYQELLPPRFMNIHEINDTHRHISMIYFATSSSRNVREGVAREASEEIRWFTRGELDDPDYGIRETIAYYAKAALDAAAEAKR